MNLPPLLTFNYGRDTLWESKAPRPFGNRAKNPNRRRHAEVTPDAPANCYNAMRNTNRSR